MNRQIFYILIWGLSFSSISSAQLPDDRQDYALCQTLLGAAANGNLRALKKYIGKIDINIQNSTGYTALHWAASNGQTHIVNYLLTLPNIDVNLKTDLGFTPLHLAMRTHQYDTASEILDSPKFDINIQDTCGRTPLMFAISQNHMPLIRAILKKPGLKINVQDDQKNSYLMLAVRTRNHELISELLQMADINITLKNAFNQTALDIATMRYDTFSADLITNKLKEIDINIDKAIENSDDNRLAQLLNQVGLDRIDAYDNSIFHKACKYNKIDIARFILLNTETPAKLFCTVNHAGQTPLELANPTSDLFKLCLDLAYTDTCSAPTSLLEVTSTTEKKHLEPLSKQTINTQCAYCKKTECTKWCAACRKVYYCSEACQKKDWRNHKNSCKPN